MNSKVVKKDSRMLKAKQNRGVARRNRKVSDKSRMFIVVAAFGLIGITLALFASASTDKYFEPTVALSRQGAAAFLYRSAGSPAVPADTKCKQGSNGPFSDVNEDHLFCKEIEWMSRKGITKAYSDGTFRPTDKVTRQVLATFMYRAAGSPSFTMPEKSPFKDVTTDNPNYKAIAWLKVNNYTAGYADGTFKPTDNVSRQAAAVFLHKRVGSPKPKTSSQVFADVNSGHPFYEQIQWLGEEEVAVGYTEPMASLRPKANESSTKDNTKEEDSSSKKEEDSSSNDETASGGSKNTAKLYFNPSREVSRQAMAVFLYRAAGEPRATNNTVCKEGATNGPFVDVPASHMFCKQIEWAKNKGIIQGFQDGEFRPNEPVNRQAAAAFVYRLDGSKRVSDSCGDDKSGPFSDISGKHIFCDEIDYVKEKKFLNGYDDGTFRPLSSISRQAVAAMLYRMAGSPPVSSTATFADVDVDHKFFEAITWITNRGITTGDTVKRTRYIDPLSNQELGPGAQGDLVINLQTRLKTVGFDGMLDITGVFDGVTGRAVEYWQEVSDLKKTGIFNCGRKNCQIDPVDLKTLQEQERKGKRFDISPLLAQLEAEEKARNERENVQKADVAEALRQAALQANPNWDILEGHKLCVGVYDRPDVVGHLQFRLQTMGYGGMIGASGDYTRRYDEATAFNINLWRQMYGNVWDDQSTGCFVSDKMLGQLKEDFDRGFRFNPGPLMEFFNPKPPAPVAVTAGNLVDSTYESLSNNFAKFIKDNAKNECIVWYKNGNVKYDKESFDSVTLLECYGIGLNAPPAKAVIVKDMYSNSSRVNYLKHHLDWPKDNQVVHY